MLSQRALKAARSLGVEQARQLVGLVWTVEWHRMLGGCGHAAEEAGRLGLTLKGRLRAASS